MGEKYERCVFYSEIILGMIVSKIFTRHTFFDYLLKTHGVIRPPLKLTSPFPIRSYLPHAVITQSMRLYKRSGQIPTPRSICSDSPSDNTGP